MICSYNSNFLHTVQMLSQTMEKIHKFYCVFPIDLFGKFNGFPSYHRLFNSKRIKKKAATLYEHNVRLTLLMTYFSLYLN